MNLYDAKKIFERKVLASRPDCALMENASREYPCCFIFFYQSKKFIETGRFEDISVGSGPVLISRESGEVFETGSGFSVDHYVKAFDACGDPYGTPTDKVKILACNPTVDKIRAIRLVKEKSGLGLSQAKAVIDNVLARKISFFIARNRKCAEEAVIALKDCGFESVQLWSSQR
jgi:hypothetical protein